MDHGACNVIYLDRRAQDEVVRRGHLHKSKIAANDGVSSSDSYFSFGKGNGAEVFANVNSILATFHEVHICSSGTACLDKLADLHQNPDDRVPTVLLIDVPYDEEQRLKRISREPRTPSPTAMRRTPGEIAEPDDIYGMHLLTHISSSIQARTLPKLIIPVVILTGLEKEAASTTASIATSSAYPAQVTMDNVRWFRYVDAGAVDVLRSPLTNDQTRSLAVHAYRIHKEVSKEDSDFLSSKRNRKLSWVGVAEKKPYAYLREAMVSGLFSGICNPETVGDAIDPNDWEVQPDRRLVVEEAIGTWSFSAHDFTEDELLYGCLLMLEHALEMPELKPWKMTRDELIIFLIASQRAYNEFVLYHNFRHVADVLQALFYFLVQIGTLPPYPRRGTAENRSPCSAIASLLKPFDALTLLVSAIGHDVGHPGVNNAFLVALNAPLAQLYNDRSVLESFHCAAYSQILRRYWPDAFKDMKMRKLMINSILATDMGLHFRYMADLGNLQEKLAHNQHKLDGWSAKLCEEYKELACGLLIKCADISNVARKFEVAARWAAILTDEFSNQGTMEKELEIPTCLFGGPPVRDDMIKMGESQIGFMNIFARPLFEAVMDILPAMKFSVDEILTNKVIWENKIKDAKTSIAANPEHLTVPDSFDGSVYSPKSISREDILPTEAELIHLESPEPNQTASQTSQPGLTAKSASSSSTRRLPAGQSHQPSETTPSHPLSHVRRGSDMASRRSSAADALGTSSYTTADSRSHSRRGSADPSLTAFIVTQPQKSPSRREFNCGPRLRSMSPAQSPEEKLRPPAIPHDSVDDEELSAARPVTAPGPRHSRVAQRGMRLEFGPHPSHSRSDQNLAQTANGNADSRHPWHRSHGGDDSVRPLPAQDGPDTQWRHTNWPKDQIGRDPRRLAPNDPVIDKVAYLTAIRSSQSSNTNNTGPDRAARRTGLSRFFRRWKTHPDKEREAECEVGGSTSGGGS